MNQIYNLLNCDQCSQNLDKPFTLQCGSTICQKCVLDITKLNENKFKCTSCSSIHQIPINGFSTCKILSQLLDLKAVQQQCDEKTSQFNYTFSLDLTNDQIKNALELWT